MSYQLSSFRYFPSAFAVVAASALAFGGLLASTSPAYAGESDYRCAGLVEQARAAADGAEGSKQQSAKRYVATGVKLCEAGNERAAAKQFRTALKITGVAEVEPDARMASR
ncbi:MAG: hypothetical protein U0S50_11220 [Sphingopyxis sp.]|uniref:hypothetical protein n=1 Tax=Sphingopyxis sp. TaxID=1908224 RepID=UPI002AB8F072|nr:hypothetical protein [Sphingopyxis sp.]MDZ3832376.1 hypothetical protein [Sphingopyxis sp.]